LAIAGIAPDTTLGSPLTSSKTDITVPMTTPDSTFSKSMIALFGSANVDGKIELERAACNAHVPHLCANSMENKALHMRNSPAIVQ